MHGVIVRGTYYKNEKDSQILRMGGGSWSINIGDIEKENLSVDRVIYQTATAIYSIDYVTACTKGFECTLRGERKLVVPLKYWTKVERS